jgi:hypothetical protein
MVRALLRRKMRSHRKGLLRKRKRVRKIKRKTEEIGHTTGAEMTVVLENIGGEEVNIHIIVAYLTCFDPSSSSIHEISKVI